MIYPKPRLILIELLVSFVLENSQPIIYKAEASTIEAPLGVPHETNEADIVEEVFIPRSSRIAYERNNPFNLRSSGKFRYFPSRMEGWEAGERDIFKKLNGESSHNLTTQSTLLDLISLYAPESDGNNPNEYAEWVAKELKVSIHTTLSDLDAQSLAPLIAFYESGSYIIRDVCRDDMIWCNCYLWVKSKIPHLPKMEAIVSNSPPTQNSVLYLFYGKVKHIAHTMYLFPGGVYISECNFKRGKCGERFVSWEYIAEHNGGFFNPKPLLSPLASGG